MTGILSYSYSTAVYAAIFEEYIIIIGDKILKMKAYLNS
jgi:hypothetical protein